MTWWISMEYALRLRTTRSGELNVILFLDRSRSFNPSSVAHTTCGGWMNEQFLIEYKKVSPRNVFRVLPLKSWRVFGFYESRNVLRSWINNLSGFWLVVFFHTWEKWQSRVNSCLWRKMLDETVWCRSNMGNHLGRVPLAVSHNKNGWIKTSKSLVLAFVTLQYFEICFK